MLKKLLSSILALSFIFTLSLSSFASGSSPSAKEIVEKGELVESEILSTDKGAYKKMVYSYTEKLPSTRTTEQEYEKTVSVFMVPLLEGDPFVKDITDYDSVNLKIRWVTRPYADGLPQYEGYKLTRIIVTTYNSDVDLDYVRAINVGMGSSSNPKDFDLSGYSTPSTITKYPSFTNYVPEGGDCRVGAQLHYYYNGSAETLSISVFNNII